MTHKETHTGINGSGHKTWLVVTVRESDGAWLHIEHFDNEAEADSWTFWA